MVTAIGQIRQLLSILCSVVKTLLMLQLYEIPQGVERWSDLDRLNRERDLVGIYLSAHPLDEFFYRIGTCLQYTDGGFGR